MYTDATLYNTSKLIFVEKKASRVWLTSQVIREFDLSKKGLRKK
jgi:hypothetical protein